MRYETVINRTQITLLNQRNRQFETESQDGFRKGCWKIYFKLLALPDPYSETVGIKRPKPEQPGYGRIGRDERHIQKVECIYYKR